MHPAFFEDLQEALKTSGPQAVIDDLQQKLTEAKDYHGLFYALLLKKRVELGVSPVPTGSNADLPPGSHADFEEAIRNAGRKVGHLYLDAGNLPAAWSYFRMIGEPEPVKAALEKTELGENDDPQPLIEIAFQQGVDPKRGFDWLLSRYGICSAITTVSGGELPFGPDVRDHCIKRLIRALHGELLHRLKSDIKDRQGFEPTGQSIRELIQGRDFLFGEEFYHIDVSHLSAVVQMSIQLENSEEMQMARDLCAYGKNLSTRFLYQSDPPFENQYEDYDMYLSVLTGENVEGGLAHFEAKADAADPHEIGSYPAEVLVNLLLRLGKTDRALAIGKKHLARLGDQKLSCPNIVELCQKTGDFKTLAEVAREQGNLVLFTAGLLGAKKSG